MKSNSGEEKNSTLIVGQGLAGSCMAFELLRNKRSFEIIDLKNGSESSRIAAGTINPLAIRTFSPVWNIEHTLPSAMEFYTEFSEFLGEELFAKRQILKLFNNDEQKDLWEKKRQEAASKPYMLRASQELPNAVIGKYGFGSIQKGGNVHMSKLLVQFRNELRKRGLLMEDNFDHEKFEAGETEILYNGKKYERVIFCQGHEGHLNPLFDYVPFKQTKGEALIIHCPGLQNEDILNNRINIVPLGGQRFWAGATFEWKDLSLTPNKSVRTELEEKIQSIIQLPFEVEDQWVGVRPTIKDRRPVLGRSAKNKDIFIFNGLGTRGVTLAPYCTIALHNFIWKNQDLPEELNVERFNESM